LRKERRCISVDPQRGPARRSDQPSPGGSVVSGPVPVRPVPAGRMPFQGLFSLRFGRIGG
jgi:hypothetical protein